MNWVYDIKTLSIKSNKPVKVENLSIDEFRTAQRLIKQMKSEILTNTKLKEVEVLMASQKGIISFKLKLVRRDVFRILHLGTMQIKEYDV